MMAMFSDKSPEPTPFTPVSFVDGHASYIKCYFNELEGTVPINYPTYEIPASCGYQNAPD